MRFKVLQSDGKRALIEFVDSYGDGCWESIADGCNDDLGTLSDAELQIAQRLDAGSDAGVIFDFIEGE